MNSRIWSNHSYSFNHQLNLNKFYSKTYRMYFPPTFLPKSLLLSKYFSSHSNIVRTPLQ